MSDIQLVRRLRALARIVLMLETELRHGNLDTGLIADIDQRMEDGIATDPRCEELRPQVDALRESTMTPRRELIGDTVRACERLRDTIEGIVVRVA